MVHYDYPIYRRCGSMKNMIGFAKKGTQKEQVNYEGIPYLFEIKDWNLFVYGDTYNYRSYLKSKGFGGIPIIRHGIRISLLLMSLRRITSKWKIWDFLLKLIAFFEK
jgi:hypothetical protein